MTSVAVQQEEPQSAVTSPILETDQALQEHVEQKLQELVNLLEKHSCTYWDSWEAPANLQRLFGPGVAPPQFGCVYPRLGEIQEILFLQQGQNRPLPMLHAILEWYMNYSSTDLSR